MAPAPNTTATQADETKDQNSPEQSGMIDAKVQLPRDMYEFLRGEAADRNISTGEMFRIVIENQRNLYEALRTGFSLKLLNKNRTLFDVNLK